MPPWPQSGSFMHASVESNAAIKLGREGHEVLIVPGRFLDVLPKASGENTGVFAFGPFLLDAGEGILRRSGKTVDLFPKTVDLLGVLVAAGGSVVRKETLLKTVWPGTFVEEATLSKNVSLLRKALGDRAYIETVTRRGYRFTAAVTAVEPEA